MILLDRQHPLCPSAFNWRNVADNDSMFNTPPTLSIYIAGLVFEWLEQQGGVAAMAEINDAKTKLLYGIHRQLQTLSQRRSTQIPLLHERAVFPT